MITLSEPSQEIAVKIMSELGKEESLGGYEMSASGGNSFYLINNFKAAVNFMRADSYKNLMTHGNKRTIGYIDLGVLQRWIDEVFGDHELATAIKEEIDTGEFYGKQMPRVKELMQQRLNQCQEKLG